MEQNINFVYPSTLRHAGRQRRIRIKWINRPAQILERENIIIGTADTRARDQDDILDQRLEAGPEMLPRLDQHIAFFGDIDADAGEAADVERLITLFTDDNVDRAGIEDDRASHTDLRPCHHRTGDFEAAVGNNSDLAWKVMKNKEKLGSMERELKAAHIGRLHLGFRESIDTSSIHLDLLSNLKRINHHITNISYPIIRRTKEVQD